MTAPKRYFLAIAVLAICIVAGTAFFWSLRPVRAEAGAPGTTFAVSAGEGFRGIGAALQKAGIIRSSLSFDILVVIDGRAGALKAGAYRLSPSMSTSEIVAVLSAGTPDEVTVTIPEGSSIYDIDRILSNALVIRPGELISFMKTDDLEGRLFPDTYRFYTNDAVADVVAKMTADFNTKAQPLLAADTKNEERNIIIASIVEKEVPGESDQELVAGIILKRLSAGMPLDIDATVCYGKLRAGLASSTSACELTALDFKSSSPYNTYLYKGLPPTPIGNPGISAITAALHPQASPYLYYLSDPKTGKTIFAKTLDEQNQNRVKYLESN